MNSGEQSAAFMVIVDDPTIEIVQEPQKNVIEGTVIQYIGVARLDEKGLVQVGIRPEILEETLANTEIDVVLKDIDYGENGYVFAIDIESGLVLAHPNEELIGKKAEEIGVLIEAGEGKTKIDGTTGYYVAEEYDGSQGQRQSPGRRIGKNKKRRRTTCSAHSTHEIERRRVLSG